jgi:hypothetical protein
LGYVAKEKYDKIVKEIERFRSTRMVKNRDVETDGHQLEKIV